MKKSLVVHLPKIIDEFESTKIITVTIVIEWRYQSIIPDANH